MMTLTTGPAGKHARWLRAIALALLALLLADLTGAQEIYRCPSASGVAVFQQMPCTGGQLVEVGTLNVIQSQMPSPEVMRDMHVRRAIARGELVAGMTEQEVRQVMGTPSAVNRSASVHGSHPFRLEAKGRARRSRHSHASGRDASFRRSSCSPPAERG